MKSKLWLAVVIIGIFSAALASAQVEVTPGVARVSLIHGDVSTQRGDTNDWSAAALNQPIVAGDKVSTGDRSRAEVQLDHANILRLGNNSQANIANLTRTNIQVQVGQGLAYYSVFKESEAEIEIDTPNVSVRPTSRDGVYRIEVTGSETQVTVRKGSADISTPQGSARVEKGQSAIIRGTADQAEYKLANAPSKDSWDSWNNERDGVIRNAQSWGRTSQYYVGSEDLDAYGHWVNVPDYGFVWQPVVAYGWAPYRAGRWVWEPYWGWTWVSYEPWGWAPYHYGRWFYYGSSWVWWPGPVYPRYRPIWAPAYVSFFGFGRHSGFSVGFGFGSFGWLPIGPGDRYYPWWGGNRSRYNVVNVTNITNITNITNVRNVHGGIAPLHHGGFSNVKLASSNDAVRGAISTVPAEHFGTGASKPSGVSREDFRKGNMLAGDVPVVPTKAATTINNRPAPPSAVHANTQRFFTKNTPATPESFDRQAGRVQDAVEHSPQATARPAKDAGAAVKTGGDAVRPSDRRAEATGSVSTNHNDGFRKFGDAEAQNRKPDSPSTEASPSPSSQPRNETTNQRHQGTSGTGADRSGWRKFSDTNTNTDRGHTQTTPTSQPRATSPAPRTEYQNARPSAPVESNRPIDRSEGWQKFTPRAESESPSRAEPSPRGSVSSDRTPQSYSRSERAPEYRNETRSSRPPLNLRQPIVTPRPAERGAASSGGGGGGGNRGGGGGRSEARSSGGGGHSSGGSSGGQSHSSNKTR